MAKKAILTRRPDYYVCYDVGEEMTFVSENGYNNQYGALDYLFVNDVGIEQNVLGGDFRWIDEVGDDQSRIAELEAEVAELKEKLSAAMTLLKGAL